MVSNVTRFTRNALVASALVIGGLPALALAQGTATPPNVTAPRQPVSQAGTVPAVTNAVAAKVKPDDAKKAADTKKAADLKAIPAKPAVPQPAIAKTGETVKNVKTTSVKASDAKAIDSEAVDGKTGPVAVPLAPKL